jgi:hypothetical protein
MTHRKITEASSPHDAHQAQLERLIHGVLREQPTRRAPASLEARVLARIQQQHAVASRSMGFSRWPIAARIALLVALAIVAKFTLDAVVWVFSTPAPVVTHTVESSVTWAKSTASLFSSLLTLGQSLFNVIPGTWIALALAVAAGMYITLFVLGATAYRTLYLNK